MSARDLREWLDGFVRAPRFLARYPYYAAVLAKLTPVADPTVSRMAVSLHGARYYLHVNVDSFVAQPEYLTGILLHEVHHVVLGHLSHPKFREVAHEDLMELCVEMSANEYIEEPLPDPIVWKSFAPYGIRAGQSTLERYEILAAQRRAGALHALPAARDVDDHGPWADAPPPPGAVEHTRTMLREALDGAEMPDPTQPLPKHLRLAGQHPGRLLETLTGVLAPPECAMDWKAALAMFVVRARAPVHTYARPNRRFPARVGEIPGRAWSPRVLAKPHLLVAIDTSLSMTADELAEVSRQLVSVSERARVTVAECDTEVTRVYGFDGAVRNVSGRGGTDLRPVFDRELLARVRPDGVVYFTDGEGPLPERAPAIPVLWVLTKPGAFACRWGERARLERKSRQNAPR